jgi:hypothetical protein
MVAGATESAKIIVQQVRGNIAHRPARAHRGRSPVRFVEFPKQTLAAVPMTGGRIDAANDINRS